MADSAHEAAAKGHVDALRVLVKQCGSEALTAADANGSTPAHRAALNGHVDVLRFLAEQCGSEALMAADAKGRTPAHGAAFNGHVDVLRFLTERCGSEALTATRADGATPAHDAARSGQVDVLRFLAEQCGSEALMAADAEGYTPAHTAALNVHVDVLRVLAEQCGSEALMAADAKGRTPAHGAAFNGHVDVLRFLTERCGSEALTATRADGATPAHDAARSGQVDVLRFLAEQCGSEALMAADAEGYTPAHTAALNVHVDVLRFLAEQCGSEALMAADAKGRTPAHGAAFNGHVDVLRVLAEQCGSEALMAADAEGYTPAHTAALNVHVDVLRFLAEQCGSEALMAADAYGRTPARLAINRAAVEGHIDVLRFLAEKCGSEALMAADAEGYTPAHTAALNGHVDVLRVLTERCGKQALTAAAANGVTPAHRAALNGHVDVLRVLTEQCGRQALMAAGANGRTPAHGAAFNGHVDVLRFLTEQCGRQALTAADANGGTPARLAARGRHVDALRFLAEQCGSDVLTPSEDAQLAWAMAQSLKVAAPPSPVASARLALLQRQLEDANALAARLEKKLALQAQQTHVPASEIVLEEQIGRGTFGVVRRARWQGADIAVKVVAADTSAAERKRAAGMLLKEAETLGRVRHPNVVHLLGVCTDYGSPMMLLPLATGTLVDELDAASASGVPMAVGRKLQLARDICAGMAALHSRGILHLDLKPANVLISRAEEALVADFGLSLQLRTTLTGASLAASALATAAGARGTMAYKAPELSRPKRKGGANYAKPCDVYSFAMLLWELFAGHPPWAGKPEMEIQAAHMDSFYGEEPLRPDLPSAPAKALELMVVSWSQDPAARPTFEALASELGALVAAHPVVSDGAGSSAAAAAVASEALARRLAEAEAELTKLRAAVEHATAGKATLQTQLQITSDEVVALRHDCGTAEVELARQQALLKRSQVHFPATWSSQSDDGGDRGSIDWWRSGRCQVLVDASGSEWAEVEGQLKESLPTAELVRLERVEDRLLWRDYCSKRDRIRLTRGGDANEQKMWHGTSALDPHKALEHEVGIDPRFSSAAFYGRGVYLAAKARYSNGDEDRSYVFYPDYPGKELRQLLLLRAAVGVSKDFGSLVSRETQSLTKPPEQSPGVLFDSVQGGPHRPSRAGEGNCDSTMVVMYDLTQAYPEYIVTYRVREISPGWFRWR